MTARQKKTKDFLTEFGNKTGEKDWEDGLFGDLNLLFGDFDADGKEDCVVVIFQASQKKEKVIAFLNSARGKDYVLEESPVETGGKPVQVSITKKGNFDMHDRRLERDIVRVDDAVGSETHPSREYKFDEKSFVRTDFEH